jgi:hypothetical protein
MRLSFHASVYSAFVRHATFIAFPPFPIGLCVPLEAVIPCINPYALVLFNYVFLFFIMYAPFIHVTGFFCSVAYNFYFVSVA